MRKYVWHKNGHGVYINGGNMKVRCIAPRFGKLTSFKLYDVLQEYNDKYKVIDDNGNESCFVKNRFENIDV